MSEIEESKWQNKIIKLIRESIKLTKFMWEFIKFPRFKVAFDLCGAWFGQSVRLVRDFALVKNSNIQPYLEFGLINPFYRCARITWCIEVSFYVEAFVPCNNPSNALTCSSALLRNDPQVSKPYMQVGNLSSMLCF